MRYAHRSGWVAAVVLLVLSAAGAGAQGTPGTDVYLAPITTEGGRLHVGTPVNVTRRVGYDNQPSFAPDGNVIYYTSYRDGQADVYRFDVPTQRSHAVTATPESEYSPTVTPGGTRLSVVRVEADSTQRLWTFALDGSDPRLLIADVAPVGYHAWLDPDVVALFVLGSPATLQMYHARAGAPIRVADDIGRTLAAVPGSADFSFIRHGANGENWITIYRADGSFDRLAETPGSEFFAWMPDGSAVLAADDARIFAYSPAGAASWEEIGDLSGHGITGITRLAVSPDGRTLALVAADQHD